VACIHEHQQLPKKSKLLNFHNSPKIIEQFQYRLSIKLPEDPLVQYKTPENFLDAVSTCPTPLNLQLDLTEEMQKEQLKKNDPTFNASNIFNFLDNVPSDYFRIIHPKMKSE
jgi:hypothetical protein